MEVKFVPHRGDLIWRTLAFRTSTASEAPCILGIFSNGQKIMILRPTVSYCTEWSLISMVHLWSHRDVSLWWVSKVAEPTCAFGSYRWLEVFYKTHNVDHLSCSDAIIGHGLYLLNCPETWGKRWGRVGRPRAALRAHLSASCDLIHIKCFGLNRDQEQNFTPTGWLNFAGHEALFHVWWCISLCLSNSRVCSRPGETRSDALVIIAYQ